MSVTTPAAAAAAQFILGKVQLYKPSEPVGPQTDGSVPEDGSPRAEFHSFRQLLTRGVAVHQCAWPCEERRMVLSSQKMEKQKGIYAGSEFLSRCGSGREWPQPCVCTLSIRLKDQCEIYRGLNDLKLQASSAWLIKHVCTKSRDPEYVHVCVCACVFMESSDSHNRYWEMFYSCTVSFGQCGAVVYTVAAQREGSRVYGIDLCIKHKISHMSSPKSEIVL